jgi:hypothetical protein
MGGARRSRTKILNLSWIPKKHFEFSGPAESGGVHESGRVPPGAALRWLGCIIFKVSK